MNESNCITFKGNFLNELKKVNTPSRYLGTEFGSHHKDLKNVDLHFCLAFPSMYEIGMSFTGFQILYQMINNKENFFAERTYLPDYDLNLKLREEKSSLFSLETKTPLKQFDIIGFSLQYELSILAILEMLDLSNIPLLSSKRNDDMPLIIAGGPLCYNPLPFSKIFDAFFVGDAEDTYINFLETISKLKKQKKNKDEILKEISKIEGVLVPKYFDKSKKIKRQVAKDFEKISSFNNPVIPFCKIIHDRLAIEIQRGCTRGCRFCQAGFLYRPLREKGLDRNFNDIITAIKNTGFEEVSLLSLSTADYSNIIELIKLLKPAISPFGETTLSFPSTRVDKLSTDLLCEVQESNRKSFTIAPEGGTQKIRNVINKCINEEQIITACKNAFSLGWKSLKMYFMIGLPTEEDEDITGIADLAIKIQKLFPKKHITVSVSTFVPKAHTPFEVCEQIDTKETLRRQDLLFSILNKNKIEYRFNKAFTSTLEGLIARGDENLTPLFLEVFKNYPKEEISKEFINKEIWENAIETTKIDIKKYLSKREERNNLPWKIIDTGILDTFLENEYQKAIHEETTIDCKLGKCSGCGICPSLRVKNIIKKDDGKIFEKISNEINDKKLNSIQSEEIFYYRMRYKKINSLKLLSYFETMGCFTRALRRSDLPLLYTKGFTPRIDFSFSLPLQLGIESECEFLDLKLSRDIDLEEIKNNINKNLPTDLQVISIQKISKNTPSIQSVLKSYTYQVNTAGKEILIKDNWETLQIEKKKQRKKFNVQITNFLELCKVSKDFIIFKTKFFDDSSVKPRDAFFYLTGENIDDFETKKINIELKENDFNV